MALNHNILPITLTGAGTEIPTLDVSTPYTTFLLKGAATAIGNYAIVPTGTPQLGTTYKFIYTGTLDITTNGTTFAIFGTSITQAQLTKTWSFSCTYTGTAWETELLMDFAETAIVSTANLTDLCVTTAKINNLAVTSGKLAADSVITVKILDQNVTTPKLADDAVTTAKILDGSVTTNKLANNAVTNSKMATMANLTVKGNISGGVSQPSDITISSFINGYGWGLTGNSGTVAGTNFIGTTDAIDVVFKRNSIECGRIGGNSTSFGNSSLSSNIGSNNVAFGTNSLHDVTTGINNTAIGTTSLATNLGDENTGVGANVGATLTTGDNNILIGSNADVSTGNATNRIAIGYNSVAAVDNSFYIPSTITTVSFSAATITSEGLAITSKAINTTAGDSATINATAGRFRKDTSGTTFTLTNSYITANSIIIATFASAPGATGYDALLAVAGAGSAVFTFATGGTPAAPAANTDVNFWVIN